MKGSILINKRNTANWLPRELETSECRRKEKGVSYFNFNGENINCENGVYINQEREQNRVNLGSILRGSLLSIFIGEPETLLESPESIKHSPKLRHKSINPEMISKQNSSLFSNKQLVAAYTKTKSNNKIKGFKVTSFQRIAIGTRQRRNNTSYRISTQNQTNKKRERNLGSFNKFYMEETRN